MGTIIELALGMAVLGGIMFFMGTVGRGQGIGCALIWGTAVLAMASAATGSPALVISLVIINFVVPLAAAIAGARYNAKATAAIDPRQVTALQDAMTDCVSCRERVHLLARVCPHCQRDPRTGQFT